MFHPNTMADTPWVPNTDGLSENAIQRPAMEPTTAPIALVLYQPEIPGNTGTLMRLATCWNAALHLIGPLGFVRSDRQLKRSGMDYAHGLSYPLHASWLDYAVTQKKIGHCRNIAVVPHAGLAHTHFSFSRGDHLIMGSESSGLPQDIIQQCDEVVHIPMVKHSRSLNLAIASAIVWAEALRQTHGMDYDNASI